MKRVFLPFLGGPWDGGIIEAPGSPWTPPLRLWVFINSSPITPVLSMHQEYAIDPKFWDLKMYAAPGAHGPYVAKCLMSSDQAYEFLFQFQTKLATKANKSPKPKPS